MSDERNLVFIGLGSNLGNREKALNDAISLLPPEITLITQSHIYETPPWGYTNQPAFLNQAVKAVTRLPPDLLLKKLKGIEKSMGRKPNFKYGPRTIDLDILFYNDEIIDTGTLSLPHKGIVNRAFVLVPLLDIAYDLIHPVTHESIEKITDRIDTSGIVLYKEINVNGENHV